MRIRVSITGLLFLLCLLFIGSGHSRWAKAADVEKPVEDEVARSLLADANVAYVFGDAAKAVQIYRGLAEKGHAEAQFKLVYFYSRGIGVEKDIGLALAWLQKAAEQEHPEACYQLGVFHLTGTGTPKNPAEAFRWLKKAAESGPAEAQFQVGYMYIMGQGISRDLDKGKKWLAKAAQSGSTRAGQAIANLRKEGLWTEADDDPALADEGAPDNSLGTLYRKIDELSKAKFGFGIEKLAENARALLLHEFPAHRMVEGWTDVTLIVANMETTEPGPETLVQVLWGFRKAVEESDLMFIDKVTIVLSGKDGKKTAYYTDYISLEKWRTGKVPLNQLLSKTFIQKNPTIE